MNKIARIEDVISLIEIKLFKQFSIENESPYSDYNKYLEDCSILEQRRNLKLLEELNKIHLENIELMTDEEYEKFYEHLRKEI